jgi:transcriptional regulator with XRE-family HTH domain
MDAGTLVRTARLRRGLTQHELAKRAGIPQPMISSIERGLQDPRYSTFQRLLEVLGLEIDIAATAGIGIDRTQFAETLRLSPAERMHRTVTASRAMVRLLKDARRLRS